MMTAIAIAGYRSLRELVLPLERLTIVTGPNGSGKSNLYKALRLLADVAQGRVISAVAHEGGLDSVLWAGPEVLSRAMERGEAPVQGGRRRKGVSLRLGFASEDYGYAIDLGLPTPGQTMFSADPEIKAEALWIGQQLSRRNQIAERRGPHVQILDDDGRRQTVLDTLPNYDSMMARAASPTDAQELHIVRERLRAWRFYDHFRTDSDAPARHPQIGTRSPTLASTGANVAAALQTIREIGDSDGLDATIEDAFPGCMVEVENTRGFEMVMHQQGLLRPLRAAELSDGTLRYLLLTVALFSPRPPPLFVLNEPETSIHADLVAPLARLIARASERSQIIVVTHESALESMLAAEAPCASHALTKKLGETVIEGVDAPGWSWPSR